MLNYFLGDDTIEILEITERNNGRMPWPKLIRRQKLPKLTPNELLSKFKFNVYLITILSLILPKFMLLVKKFTLITRKILFALDFIEERFGGGDGGANRFKEYCRHINCQT